MPSADRLDRHRITVIAQREEFGIAEFTYLPSKSRNMEKRILGLILSVLGVIGLIYAGITFLNGGLAGRNLRVIIFAGVLGAIFFSAGIGLIKRTKDKPT